MKRIMVDIWFVFKSSFIKWYKRNPFRESAAIAFNAVFSLPGLMVVVMSVGGTLFGTDAFNGHLHREIAKVMGNGTADQVNEMVVMAYRSRDSVIATILGIATILAGATGVFVQLQDSLNTIWEVKASPDKSTIKIYVIKRLFSFGMILTIAFLLLVSLVINTLLSAVSIWMKYHWSDLAVVMIDILNVVFGLVIASLLFALMFKVLPDAKIKWRGVWAGALFTAIAFNLGKAVLAYYFGHADPGKGYGAAGSIILIMLWAAYSSLILLYGAVFTRTYSEHFLGKVPPEEIAVRKKKQVEKLRV